jgi:hypothetical protein
MEFTNQQGILLMFTCRGPITDGESHEQKRNSFESHSTAHRVVRVVSCHSSRTVGTWTAFAPQQGSSARNNGGKDEIAQSLLRLFVLTSDKAIVLVPTEKRRSWENTRQKSPALAHC